MHCILQRPIISHRKRERRRGRGVVCVGGCPRGCKLVDLYQWLQPMARHDATNDDSSVQTFPAKPSTKLGFIINNLIKTTSFPIPAGALRSASAFGWGPPIFFLKVFLPLSIYSTVGFSMKINCHDVIGIWFLFKGATTKSSARQKSGKVVPVGKVGGKVEFLLAARMLLGPATIVAPDSVKKKGVNTDMQCTFLAGRPPVVPVRKMARTQNWKNWGAKLDFIRRGDHQLVPPINST